MDLHIIAPGRAPELVLRVVEGRPVIVPPAPRAHPVPPDPTPGGTTCTSP